MTTDRHRFPLTRADAAYWLALTAILLAACIGYAIDGGALDEPIRVEAR